VAVAQRWKPPGLPISSVCVIIGRDEAALHATLFRICRHG
jgi:hypothetical protein